MNEPYEHCRTVLKESEPGKRAALAGRGSDAQAVPDLPTMRRLDSGAIVPFDTVLDALRTRDAAENAKGDRPASRPIARPRVALATVWRRYVRRRDPPDDDDPPPCPAAALPPGVELELRRRRYGAWGLTAA